MAATSGDVCVVIADCSRVQRRHGRADSEARKNRFLFRIFTGIAFRSEPRHGGQLARVSIDYQIIDTVDLEISASLIKATRLKVCTLDLI